MKRGISLLVMSWLVGMPPSLAVGADTPGWLPAESAVQQAILSHPRVAAAAARRDMADSRARGLQAGSAETVLRATGQRRSVNNPTDRYAEGQLALERPWRFADKRDADYAVADATRWAGRIDLADARHEAARELLTLWSVHVRALNMALTTQGNLESVQRLMEVTRARVKVGDAAVLDADLVQAELSRLEAAANMARAAVDAAAARLSSRFPGIEPASSVQTGLAARRDAAQTAELRARYVEASHELALARAEAERAERAARRSALERRPDPVVGVFGTVERGGDERIVGVSVSIPLPGELRSTNAEAAFSEATALKRNADDIARGVAAQFDALWFDLLGRQSSAEALARAAQQQGSAAERMEKAYRLGEAGISELLQARRLVADSRLAAQAARLDLLEADLRLRLDLHEIWDFDD